MLPTHASPRLVLRVPGYSFAHAMKKQKDRGLHNPRSVGISTEQDSVLSLCLSEHSSLSSVLLSLVMS